MKSLLATVYYLAHGVSFPCLPDCTLVKVNCLRYIVPKVVRAIAEMHSKYITFPNDEKQRIIMETGFHKRTTFPKCLGVVDGTFVPIRPPPPKGEFSSRASKHILAKLFHFTEDAEKFFCRKGYNALNLCLVVDYNYKLTYLGASFPGSAHDSHVLKSSVFYKNLQKEKGFGSAILGDSGYDGKEIIIKKYPLGMKKTVPQKKFDKIHSTTRNYVERTIGLLKGSFKILKRPIETKLHQAQYIIYACGVLHNIMRLQSDLFVEIKPPDVDLYQRAVSKIPNGEPETLRDRLVNSYF